MEHLTETSRPPATCIRRPSSRGRWWIGPTLLLLVVALLEALRGTPLWLPNPPAFLLPVVVLSGLIGGLGPGLVTAGLAWVYFAYHFSLPGQPFHYSEADLRRVVVWAFSTPAMALMVGLLRRRSDTLRDISSAHASLSARLHERDRAEQALRDSEARLVQALQYARSERDRAEMYLDIAGVILVALDFDGRITLVNRRGCSILGFPESELLAKHWFASFVPEPIRERMTQEFREVMSGSRPLPTAAEYSITTRSQGERIVSWHHALLRSDTGAIIGMLSSGEDITELREQQAELRTRARQQAAVAGLGLRALAGDDLDALFDHAVRLLAEVLHVEFSKVQQLLPGSRELIVRAGVGWNEGVVGQATVDAVDSQAGYTLRGTEPVVVENLADEYRFVAPPLLREHDVISGMTVTIQGRHGPFGVLGVHSKQRRRFDEEDVDFLQAVANVLADTIERKRAEQEIRDQTERLRLALHAARMGTWAWDITTNLTQRSEETNRLLGCPPDQTTAALEEFLEIVHPEDRPQLERTIEECLRDEDCVDYLAEYRVVLPDGGVRWLADRGQVYRDSSKKPMRLIGVIMDITARKEAEEQARQHQAELAHVMRISDVDEMASGLAHELNQPLTAVVNFAQGALRRLRQGEDSANAGIVEAIEGAAAQAHRAAEIVRRLAKFVQKRQPQTATFGINEAVEEVLTLVAADARDNGAVIRTELDLENPCVSADNIQVQQVVLNLVRNGLEAMSDTKESDRVITIRTSVVDDEVLVAVSDRGSGVSAETLQNLFQPFFTTKATGMGLGLSISRSIIDAHGGRLWAANNPEGGATFQFTLPLVHGEASNEQRTDRVCCG